MFTQVKLEAFNESDVACSNKLTVWINVREIEYKNMKMFLHEAQY